MRKIAALWGALMTAATLSAQNTAQQVLSTTQKVNDYFMSKYADPTLPTNVKKVRPSSLWTRAVYYEGLMALNDIDPQQRYMDYTDRWASFHQWTPRNGIKTCDADDQCCEQTYLMRYTQNKNEKILSTTLQNLDQQMERANPKNSSIYGWWTWIDAIQMAMPVYMQVYKITGEEKYRDHAMQMYRWSRNECGGGLFNEKDGLWWRDADYVPPYKEPDGKDCYWSRGNGWVYAALVRCMNQLDKKDKAYKELKKDFLMMSEGLKKCQREDGFWNPSLVSTNYAMTEASGTALFLYGMAWGIRNGLLKAKDYREACDQAWAAMVKTSVHSDGFLGWMQGTGKDPSDGQPLSYTRVPDFEDYGTGCFLLGATEYYKLLTKFKNS
ncbi:glycoside hydrolase family 88 protein [Prevotella sp. E15-22]|uniref:glycoside hydrolase family 88/105 protein n=1 Tax=Prevotella sp. E15-22 TaxID=2937774 RepID=UPI00205A1599|nr:glycoside hydrolase family 88 protein [Prevotella sp. E15-22]UPS43602.1 glycoside hydrolase family 88 protein [Prevotella sp. E15-22]